MPGLRERKKRQTREAIAAAAAELFARRGFESVTVDDVARAADVSRQTVFNYFPTKEQMLFVRDAEVEAALVAAVRDRDGASLVSVFRDHTRAFWLGLDAAMRRGEPHGFWGIVQASPPLLDYAEATFARHARSVARVLAAERGLPGDDPLCHALARALCAVNTAMLISGLSRLTRRDDRRSVVGDTLAAADRAYDLLEDGLAEA
jgi:AcrR family transcriptional regulator